MNFHELSHSGRNSALAPKVATPRCGVTARAERAELEFSRDIRIFRCAAERGAGQRSALFRNVNGS
jgi:hypothetical protein